MLKKGALAKTGKAGFGIHPSVMRNVKSRLHDERLPKRATGSISTGRVVFEMGLFSLLENMGRGSKPCINTHLIIFLSYLDFLNGF